MQHLLMQWTDLLQQGSTLALIVSAVGHLVMQHLVMQWTDLLLQQLTVHWMYSRRFYNHSCDCDRSLENGHSRAVNDQSGSEIALKDGRVAVWNDTI